MASRKETVSTALKPMLLSGVVSQPPKAHPPSSVQTHQNSHIKHAAATNEKFFLPIMLRPLDHFTKMRTRFSG